VVLARVGQVVATMPLEHRADRPTLAAFEEVVERYQVPLRRFLYGVVQDYELAADLCQETFLSAYRALPRIEGELNVDAWLYTIALNHARGALRRRRILRWVPFVSASHDRAVAGPDLLHADGFRYAEIGHILGCSLGAVKLRIFRGRQRCLELYRRGEGEDA